ncbi:DAK2 domain-containing protein [Mycoplasma tauri]|uniref:DAK2 domain-containing protein n=1 Tax=Mycoplasma tauri TaxID=547987 RepID=A0A953NC51_9MOLU|nr:DAK2 domain-containing protein [Mycoplasma tauri]MBZ4195156.1 DAK2 domain-containing protein [Mycoplasma tauri]MBZ4203621.1 DAK2 domain-containing protein [Mycoplasma tauri]MBZ4204434.1 DAK2 domain-containing protein [Mycoplasma tauri]MBZ4226863.1 DAK2 domain-containing protein [Mycoplasma tauri]QSB07770.1 DAK2 domain-containing protein [Mycoplasma tauri]
MSNQKNDAIDGKIYSKLIISGANNLINNKNRIDALNVFPVPDGDTGTNMSGTVETAAKVLVNIDNENIGEVSAIVSKNMLLGARGNSGVIMSQIFKGFANYFQNKKSVSITEMIDAFKSATERAYQSVLKPVEGTILTVIRETTENLEKEVNKNTTLKEFFEIAKKFARIACDNTPNKLKILREVGVTDSGGEGLYSFIEGMSKYINDGTVVEIAQDEVQIDKFISSDEVYSGEFGYCTEFIIELKNEKEFNKNEFESSLSKKANSLVVVQDGELVKVHGHTLKPGNLLNFGQKYGEFIKIKSENMSLQAEDSRNKNVSLNNSDTNGNSSKCAIISCNLGTGIINKMKDLGCTAIVESGQTQNPSAADLIEAIEAVKSKDVFILPNNSNIFLTAEQAAQAIKNKKIHIIHTRTQLQGINAMLAFNKDSSAEENKELIEEVVSMIKTAEITKAVRSTTLNGIKIKENDYIAILDGKIISCKSSYIDAAKAVISKTANEETQVITIYYGNEASEADANELADYISKSYDCEVETINGNQPNYYFFIGFE